MRMTRRGLFGKVAVGALAAGVVAFAGGFGPDDDVQVAKVGDKAPDFVLKDIDGKEHRLSEYVRQGKTVVLEWFNPDCPVVLKYYKSTRTMAETYERVKGDDVVWLAINSGHEGHSTTGVERNARAKKELSIEYPILLDYEGKVGRSYGAKVTPQIVIIHQGKVAYNGGVDSSLGRGRDIGEVNYVVRAIDQIRKGETIEVTSNNPSGCSIKYARGG